MRRREFITPLGGSTVAWPLAAKAQQGERMRRIGVMMGLPDDDRSGRRQADALRQGLQDLGWMDGRNIRIDFHWDVSHLGRAQVVAKDIIAVQPDLIVTHATVASTAVAEPTKSIPIVFVSVSDPVGLGLVASYARPTGNCGFTNFEPSMGGKWVEVLKDLDPRIRRIAILFNPETAPAGGSFFLPSFMAAGVASGVEAIRAQVHDAAGIEKAVDALAREPNGDSL